MILPRRWPVLLGGLVLLVVACWAVVTVLHRVLDRGDDGQVQSERAAADSVVIQTQRENARLRVLVSAVAESAAVAKQGEAAALARADAKAARIAYLLAHPRVIIRDPMPGDTVAPPMLVDSAASCEERFSLRSEEALDLRLALHLCDRAGALQGMRADTLATANGRLLVALAASDSARRVEISRKRPCRRDLLVVHPACGTVDVVTFGLGLMAGILVTR